MLAKNVISEVDKLMILYMYCCMGSVVGECVGGLDQGLEGWCYVFIRCVDGRSRYM